MKTTDRADIHAPERIGKRRSRTPEGALLCEGVPIARTGWMVYGEGETGVKTADNGVAMIHRGPDDLFNPVTMMSFNGKAVTDDHPPGGDVNPSNWREHARGGVHNVRRGEGEEDDVLLADLLIHDADTIRAVERGKVEVSAGYDAQYETTGPGEGRQRNIVGNHVALVDRGRCGPRCAIGDSAPTITDHSHQRRKTTMAGKTRRTVTEAVRKLFTDASEAAVGLLEPAPEADGYEDSDKDDDGKGTHVHVHMHGGTGAAPTGSTGPVGAGQTGGAEGAVDAGEAAAVGEGAENPNADPVEARFVAIESTVAKILAKLGGDDTAPPTEDAAGPMGTENTGKDGTDTLDEETDPKKMTGDSVALATSYQALVADCEVLVPGFKTPTFDAAKARKITVDSMCALRRKALTVYSATGDGESSLQALSAGKTVDVAGMTCQAAAVLFNAAVGVTKALNNGRTTDGAGRLPQQHQAAAAAKPLSIHEINELNRKKYPV